MTNGKTVLYFTNRVEVPVYWKMLGHDPTCHRGVSSTGWPEHLHCNRFLSQKSLHDFNFTLVWPTPTQGWTHPGLGYGLQDILLPLNLCLCVSPFYRCTTTFVSKLNTTTSGPSCFLMTVGNLRSIQLFPKKGSRKPPLYRADCGTKI